MITSDAVQRGEIHQDPSSTPVTMAAAIRKVLEERLRCDRRVVLLGQDIEDPKGDVFGVTRGLSTLFPGRVLNAPLSESTIVGLSLGRALAGDRPVAMLQFADFLPLALNQILSELATMSWRTVGSWSAPVIVMAPCGGYRPGLGPFHSQTFDSLSAHIPGLDVLVPSSAADVGDLLSAAFESERPTIFLYPKALLYDRTHCTAEFVLDANLSLGKARRLSPWDSDAVLESAQRTGRVIVVHEDNQTGGFGAEILATLSERSCRPLTLRRVARPDTFLPCHFGNQIELLPSAPGVLTVAADLLDLEVSWSNAVADQGGSITLTARGASPADRHVTVVAWLVNPGETVVAGQLLAELESDKALTSLASPGTGIIDALLVTEGNSVAVGAPLVTLLAETSDSRATPAPTTDTLIPRISRRRGRRVAQSSGAGRHQREDSQTVQLSWPCAIAGSATVSNSMLADRFPGRTPESIFQLTGIENRCRMASGETLLGLALTAARRALEASDLALSDLAAIFCHTTTPSGTTPSLACQVLAGLTQATKEHPLVACDLQAACSGYLYALQVAHDFVNARPNARVLVITAEEMSKIVDPRDFDTAILFGDAASATILSGSALPDQGGLRLFRPVLYAAPDPTHALTVPNPGSGFVRMRGKEVFSKAVRCMLHALQEACEAAGTRMNDLDFLLPHQANGRIMDAIRTRLGTEGPRLIQAISQCGNTASSSIPLCLSQFSEPLRIDQRIGLCTFGGGFTWGGAVLQITQALASRQTANQESLEP